MIYATYLSINTFTIPDSILTMAFLYTPNISLPPADLPTHPFTFPLDPFQQHAIHAISNEHNVLVCAKTGSGKTLVGEYQIYHSLKKYKRVFYTTPIKSLSNQKFHDLKHQYPEATVGIMTGDIKFCPDAQIVIMTTEILCNLLYKRGSATEHLGLTASLHLDDLDAVIFDECHYINDKDRGHVWEETLILLPPEIKLVLLSATLEQPALFADWIGKLKQRKICLIETTYRVVPLIHTLYNTNTGDLSTLMDCKDKYNDKTYADWVKQLTADEKNHEKYRQKVKDQRAEGVTGAIDGKTHQTSFTYRLENFVTTLQTSTLLPALFFTLSRKKCEEYATALQQSLLTSKESAEVQHIIRHHLHTYKGLESLQNYHTICKLLQNGIAFHHSGIVPLLKEIIEILFSKGLIKVLFCTETFAVGLNMPTKTVVFVNTKKYDDKLGAMRVLYSDEYTQMAGRAGRRGKDTLGTVVYFPDREPLTAFEMKTMLSGHRPQITSHMDFHYSFLLKSLQSGTVRWLSIMEDSYWFRQRLFQIATIHKNIDILHSTISLLALTDVGKDVCRERETLEKATVRMKNIKETPDMKEHHKQAHRNLEQWKNKHMGPKWVAEWSRWETFKGLQTELSDAENILTILKGHARSLTPVVEFLQKSGFIGEGNIEPESLTKDHLTIMGVLASEVNEGHPILMTDLFVNKTLHALSAEELVACLACFMERDKSDEGGYPIHSLLISERMMSRIKIMYNLAEKYDQLERSVHKDMNTLQKDGYWMLTTKWVEPITEWMGGESISHICSKYGIFEGNLIRGILKIANMLDEWEALAMFCQHIDQIEKIGAVRSKIIRDMAVTDSLYLHF